MKILKIATIVSFLIIVFPGTIYFINLQSLVLNILSFILSIGIDPIKFYDILLMMLNFSTILTLFLIFKKSRLLTFACLSIQYLWLANCFNQRDLNDIYYISTMCLYFILSLILIIYLFKKPKLTANNTIL